MVSGPLKISAYFSISVYLLLPFKPSTDKLKVFLDIKYMQFQVLKIISMKLNDI